MSIFKQLRERGVALVLMLAFCKPACAAINVLMVTTNNGTLTAIESGRKTMLESWGYTVNTIWDGAPQATFNSALAANRAVFIPDEATAAEVGYKLRETTIGVVSEHPGLADELGICSGAATTSTSNTINVVNNTHYVTSVFATGNLSLGSGTYFVVNLAGTTAPGGQALATIGSNNSVVAIETGATLANTYNSSNVAFGRRVQFPLPISVNDGSSFNANTYTLAGRMLWWAAGLDRALIAHWKLDETSGAVAADSSGFSLNGTYTGSPTLGAAAPKRFGTYFASDSKYVTAPASTLFSSLGVGNADFSVAFWVKPNGTTGNWRSLFHKGNSDAERGPGIWFNPGNNRIHFRIGTTANSNEGTDSVSDLPNAVWSHVACVKAGNKWRCYVNGVLDTEFTLSAATIGNNGAVYFGDDPWWSGSAVWMDDVRVYTGALTLAEVKNLYGLVGRWKLDETSGTVAADSSSAGNTGTYTSGPLLNQTGMRDAAASFDGTDDYVGIPDSVSLKAKDSVTMAAWIRPTASANIDRMIVNKEGEYELSITATNQIEWAIANTSPGWNWHLTGVFIPNDTWSHVAVTYDGVEAKTYLNGALIETFAASGNIGDLHPTLNELRIGGRSNSPAGKYFVGLIDDVYVFTRGISAAEVADLHGLIGHWKFSEASGVTAADSTALANNATLSGGATWTSDCAGYSALQTNGVGAVAQTASAFVPPAEGTVAFWMRSSGNPSATARIFGLGGDWEVRQSTDGTLSFDLCGDATPNVVSTIPLNQAGRWYHVVETFNSTNDTYAIYIDGQLNKTGTNSVAMVQQAAAVLSFGTRTGSAEYWQGGALRDFRIYNRRLNLSEIAQLYGLVGHWKFDELAGTTASDSSGTGSNGTVTSTPSWPAGRLNNCIQLNGTNRVEVNSLLNAPKNLTVTGWANLTAADTSGAEIVSIGDYIALRLNDSGTSKVCFYNGSAWVSVSASQTFTNTGWHHFAGVFNDDQNFCKLYIDGVEVASAVTAVTLGYTGLGTKTVIGAHGNGSTTVDFTGKIDDVRIYNRALCPAEITTLSSGGFSGVKITKWVEIQ